MHPETKTIDSRWGQLSPLHDPMILANFKPRATDVLITTAPKAGTTWMQQILHQLRSGGDASFTSIDEVVPWLEIQRYGKSWQDILQHFETQADPRVFKTHCTAEQTPGVDTVNIILTSRDPRDCCVSFYHHIMNMTDEARANKQMPVPESFDQHVHMWLEYAAWYRNVKSWWPYYNNANVLWLRYQDLKSDFISSIEQILKFLQWHVTDEQKQKVLEYCSFDWMKANDEKFSSQGPGNTQVFKAGKFIRQGKVGKFQELMTTEQEQRILEKAKKLLEPACLNFLELDS
jgi:hypothetical protein